MNDDQLDDLLMQGARDYNEPGAVPRDEIWTRIQAQREARTLASSAGGHGRGPATGRRTWQWASIAAAAALILAAGIAIGRRLERSPQTNPSIAAVKPEGVSPKPEVVAAKPDSFGPTPVAAPDPRSGSRQTQSELSPAYQLVVLQHLVGSEAMITAFRSAARRGDVDAQLAAWSRDLLGTTRMLEASPVTQDPSMKRLLDDLDLILVQITQYATRGTKDPDDLDLIEQSINKRGVITKLRSPLPGRTAPAGT